MQVDSTGTRLAPRQFNSAIEVAENAKRVMAFRQKSWTTPPPLPKPQAAPVVVKQPEPKPLIDPIGFVVWPSELISGEPPTPPTVHEIQVAMSKAWPIEMVRLLGPEQHRVFCEPRQLAMALVKHLTLRSLPEIGRRFGGRDHTTVLHAIRKYEPIMADIRPRLHGASVDIWVIEAVEASRRIPVNKPQRRVVGKFAPVA